MVAGVSRLALHPWRFPSFPANTCRFAPSRALFAPRTAKQAFGKETPGAGVAVRSAQGCLPPRQRAISVLRYRVGGVRSSGWVQRWIGRRGRRCRTDSPNPPQVVASARTTRPTSLLVAISTTGSTRATSASADVWALLLVSVVGVGHVSSQASGPLVVVGELRIGAAKARPVEAETSTRQARSCLSSWHLLVRICGSPAEDDLRSYFEEVARSDAAVAGMVSLSCGLRWRSVGRGLGHPGWQDCDDRRASVTPIHKCSVS